MNLKKKRRSESESESNSRGNGNKKTVRVKKTVYFSDERNDDFSAARHVTRNVKIGGNYRYEHGVLWRTASWVLYRLVATPVAYIYCRHRFGVRIKNRRALKRLDGGYFLYGNHTQAAADAFIPSLITFPRRCDIVVGSAAVSLPVVRTLVPMLGGIPLAGTVSGIGKYMDTLATRTGSGRAVAIYPEAHIWPYCNIIRDYPDGSFVYPVDMGLPAVGFTVTYRRRLLHPRGRPHITVTVGNPVMPGEVTSRRELRDAIHTFMSDTVAREGSAEYISYKKAGTKTKGESNENERKDA